MIWPFTAERSLSSISQRRGAMSNDRWHGWIYASLCSCLFWLVAALLLWSAFAYYRIGWQVTEDGRCEVNAATIQRVEYCNVDGGCTELYRAYYSVDFSTDDVVRLRYLAAISELDHAGWTSKLSTAEAESEHFAVGGGPYSCVRGKRSVLYDADDDLSIAYLVVLGSDAEHARSRFMALFVPGVFFAVLAGLLVLAVAVDCAFGRRIRRACCPGAKYAAVN